ncbi:MAG: ribonuclease Z, partial [Marinirhabdus sp.]
MKAKNYIVLTDEKGDVEGFASFLEREIPHTHKGQNVIVNLLKYKNLKPQQLIKFIEISNSHRKTKQSFVLVSGAIDPDE